MPDISLSFITVNYKTPDLIDRLISSLNEYSPPFPFEIIVVDNDSGDNSADFIRTKHPEIKLLTQEKNIGFGAGNNRAAEKASGSILVLINPDCTIHGESFAEPAAYLLKNPDVGIVGLKVVRPDGEIEQSARGFPDPSTGLFGRSTILGKLSQKSKLGKAQVARKNLLVDPAKTEPYEVDWVAGTIMLIRRECWNRVNGFDEDFFMYWEDADICFRALKAGYKTIYFPGSKVTHIPGSSTAKNPAPSIRYFHDSAYKYVSKHISPGPSLLRAFAWLALKTRAALLIARAKRKSSGKLL